MMNYQSENIADLAAALCSAQADLGPAAKDSQNPHLKNKYTSLASVFAALREVLPKHGLAVAQTLMPSEDGKAHVRTTLMHKSGQWLAGECVMPLDKQGGPQGMGSAITYARRYSLAAIVGVVSDDDDDGNAAQGKGKGKGNGVAPQPKSNGREPAMISDAQRNNLRAIVTENIPHVKNDREIILQVLSTIFSRQINSTNELTSGEASTLISQPDLLVEFAPNEREYKTILADRQAKAKAAPRSDEPYTPVSATLPCPNRNDKPIDEMECAKCKSRQGCPSWA